MSQMCLWKSRHPGDEEPERERGEAVENLFCKLIMVRMCKLMCKLIMVRSAAKQCPRPGLRDDIWDSRQDLHRGGRWHMGGDSHPPHRLGLPSRPLPDCLNPETSHLSYSHSRLSKFLQCTMDGSKDGVPEHKPSHTSGTNWASALGGDVRGVADEKISFCCKEKVVYSLLFFLHSGEKV